MNVSSHDSDPDLLQPAGARALGDIKQRLAEHPIYRSVRGPEGLRRFMEFHAVCVLDFMTLLKTLQRELTCTTTPWVPPSDAEQARFINEIVLDEESDAEFEGRPASHYEWYLAAMEEVGADTTPIRELEARLRRGVAPADALTDCGLPPAAEAFARTTYELAAGPPHVVAAAFFHGREDVIPQMFLPLVRALAERGFECRLLRAYLERHIEADGDHHGPLAARMLDGLCEGSDARRLEAARAAARSLEAREALWDAAAAECGALDVASASR